MVKLEEVCFIEMKLMNLEKANTDEFTLLKLVAMRNH